MRNLLYSNQFKRDAKKHYLHLISKEWAEVLYLLQKDEALPLKYQDHALIGNLKDCRDCHLKPDLVLLYRQIDNNLELLRLGSHSELDL